jgi:hypothetical protein
MVVAINELTTTKNAFKSLAISMAMPMQLYNARHIADGAHPGLHLKPLDAAIGRVPVPYCPGGRHGQRF